MTIAREAAAADRLRLRERLHGYFRVLSELLLATEVTTRGGAPLGLEAGIELALDLIGRARAAGRKMMLVGNGGSAAVVSHMQNDLCKAVGVRALTFTETPLLTALANDLGYVEAFERPVELWADPGDVLLAVSSSGLSANILRAVKAAAARECRTVTFSGFRPDNSLRALGDLNFYVPAENYGHVELAHGILGHVLTDLAAAATAGSAFAPGWTPPERQ